MKQQVRSKSDAKRGQVRIVVEAGTLAPWKAALPTDERRRALLVALERMKNEKGIGEYDAAMSIARKLNALFIYRKSNRNPAVVDTCNKILDDEEWLRAEFDMAPLDRKRRQCLLPAAAVAAADLNRAIAGKAQQKKPSTLWNEFRSRHKGSGYSLAQLSQMYRNAQ